MSKEELHELGLVASWTRTLVRCGWPDEVAHNRARQLYADLGAPHRYEGDKLISASLEKGAAREMETVMRSILPN